MRQLRPPHGVTARRVRFHDPSGVTVDRSQTRRPKRYGIRFNPGQIGAGPLLVEGVMKDMAAEASGLQAGDRIVAIDGQTVSGLSQLDLAKIFGRSPLTMTVVRDGENIELTMKLE